MRREEKNELTRQQIVDSAITEFGLNNYTDASLNAISKRGSLSKGIIYHYFKDKDELYLFCVSECFNHLTQALEQLQFDFSHAEKSIGQYLDLRQQFFRANPYFSNIFTNALFQPPLHLLDEIKTIKSKLDQFNIKFYSGVLRQVDLKADFTREEAMEYFLIFQESYNHYFQNKALGDFRKLFDEHELKLSKLLKIMLYGVAKEKTEQ